MNKLNKSIEVINLDEIHGRGVTGKGIKVAVIDNALAKPNNKLDIKSNYSIDDRILYSDHATSCASIIKSSEFGIAPDCELYSLSTNDNIDNIWQGEYYAAAQICGILALLKQQNPNLKTAQDVRAILPKICEPIYGGKNNKTGYGLLKAKILN